MDFVQKVSFCRPGKNELSIFWLGQAGFLIKDHEGRVVAIDPYLTDCVERICGFKRLMMTLISPDEVNADILLITHEHGDHLDVDALPVMMANRKTVLFGSKKVIEICKSMQIDSHRINTMKAGDSAELDGIYIKAVYADHGELAPDALGFMLEMSGIRIYFAGDTAYRPKLMADAFQCRPDIAIVPVNGEFGNLNGEEAAKVARDSGAKVAIPSHFWTFAAHKGDPLDFEEKIKEIAPNCISYVMCQGEEYRYKRQEINNCKRNH